MTRVRAPRRGALRGEEGTVTAFVVIFTFAILLLAGLVIDGGLTLSAKVQAIDEAQAAARAGAQAINLPLFRSTGEVVLDPASATQAAEAYLAKTGHSGTVSVNGDDVTVTVSIAQPMQILAIAGLGHLTVSGSGSAVAEHGVLANDRGFSNSEGLSTSNLRVVSPRG
jgi:hypothetical protein